MFTEDFEPKGDYSIKKQPTIEIPEFLNKGNELPSEEQRMAQAVLNNVPNNVDIEKQNHLAELENVAVNYSDEEWKRLLYHAPSNLMADEFKRRLDYSEKYIANTRSNLELLASQKL